MFPDAKKHRALLIGGGGLADELQAVLESFGYFVEHCQTRGEGVRKFRERRQALVVVDAGVMQGAPERFFRFFGMSGGGAIVLVASGKERRADTARYLLWGAHDVILLPLRPDALRFILGRTSAYHRRVLRGAFYRNALYFGVAVLPFWGILLYFVLR
jgi:DNA-binding response OmpR family regulator